MARIRSVKPAMRVDAFTVGIWPYSGGGDVPALAMPDHRATVLYRLYDAEGCLLYLGVTRRPDLRERFSGHRRAHAWWPLVAGLAVQIYPAEHLALDAERRAIRAERPAHNLRSAVRG